MSDEILSVRAPAGARIYACPHRHCRGRIDLAAADPEGRGGFFDALCSNQHPVRLDLLPGTEGKAAARQPLALMQ